MGGRFCLLIALTTALPSVGADAQQRQLLSGLSGDFYASVKSMRDLKFATVIRQKYDFSCGSAALATLLRYQYGLDADEAVVFQGMWRSGDRAQIQKLGFSLLDMKRYLAAEGLQGDGYKVTLADVAQKRVPGIALINIKGYKHFVVVKGIANGDVLIGDPARGLMVQPAAAFQKSWNGIYFVISPDARRGGFNLQSQWTGVARAPVKGRFLNPLSSDALASAAPYLGQF